MTLHITEKKPDGTSAAPFPSFACLGRAGGLVRGLCVIASAFESESEMKNESTPRSSLIHHS